MESYGQILITVIPIFLILILAEYIYSWYKKDDLMNINDLVSSLSSGLTNITKDVLGLSIGIIGYGWMLDHLALFTIEANWAIYILAFITIDFQGYWSHRWNHHINIFWNRHVIHHSSEYFNLACALRQSISSIFSLFTFLLLPAAIIGIPHSVIAILAPLHLFAQFWYHTTYIDKMGFLEKIIVTPSHHRVHHAINPEYLDKNLSQVFIYWDKLFGTFQEELPHVPPVYGITRQARTWNPIRINYQQLWMLTQDAWHARSWLDKIRIWFMPTGWRPEDVAQTYPVKKIDDPYHFERYHTHASTGLKVFICVQMFFSLFFIFYLLGHIADIGVPGIFLYGGFIGLSVYALTDLMDRNRSALLFETLKNILGLAILHRQQDWFHASGSIPGIQPALTVYFIMASGVTAWFMYTHWKEDRQVAVAAGV